MADVASRRRWGGLSMALKLLVALAVSVGAAWWAFEDVDLAKMGSYLERSSLPIMAIFVLAQIFGQLIRVVRWGLLITPQGPASWRAIFAAASVGFPATFFLPLRLGELVRPVMIARSGVPFAGAMASVVVERIADGLVSLGIFFVCLRFLPASARVSEKLDTAINVASWLFGVALLGLVVVAVARRPALVLIRRLLSPLPATVAERILGLLTGFLDGLTALRTAPRILAFAGLSVAFWLTMGASAWLLATSYLPELPFVAGPFAIAVVAFAIMVPAGPGFVGTFEAGYVLGLAPFGVSADASGAVAVAAHALQLVFLAALAGVGFLAAENRQRKKVLGAAAQVDPGTPG